MRNAFEYKSLTRWNDRS